MRTPKMAYGHQGCPPAIVVLGGAVGMPVIGARGLSPGPGSSGARFVRSYSSVCLLSGRLVWSAAIGPDCASRGLPGVDTCAEKLPTHA